MNSKLTKRKSKKATYSLLVALFIWAVSFLPYLHDLEYFEGMKGFSGFSSLRIAVWVISLFLIAISGWVVAFLNSKGKKYRFSMLAPIGMLVFQLCVYVLDGRESIINDFNIKVVLNLVVFAVVIILYFFNKLRSNE